MSLVEHVSNHVTVMQLIHAVVYSRQQVKVLAKNYTLENKRKLIYVCPVGHLWVTKV